MSLKPQLNLSSGRPGRSCLKNEVTQQGNQETGLPILKERQTKNIDSNLHSILWHEKCPQTVCLQNDAWFPAKTHAEDSVIRKFLPHTLFVNFFF